MNTVRNAALELNDADDVTPAAATRPLFWSVRRELWEHRSIYLAPLAVAALLVFGMVIAALFVPQRTGSAPLDTAALRAAIEEPFDMAARMIMLTAFIVGFFYCLDALYGERRDRSVLFWKSLPVSDRTAVLAKASIPLVVLPLLTFVLVLATHTVMTVVGGAGLLMRGMNGATVWPLLLSITSPLAVLYALVASALWHAPTYGWLLLVSAWAPRAPVLWALLPLVGLNVLENVAFGTSRISELLNYRGFDWYRQAHAIRGFEGAVGLVTGDVTNYVTPAQFLSAPGVWIGLTIAAALLAATVRLRRYREPI